MTVTRYNRLLSEGYRTMDMSRLREVADELQAEDEYIHMSALGEGGVRLLPVLKDRKFVKVSVEATSASVETLETWDYTHEARDSRKVLLVQKGMVYDMAWDLTLRSNGQWYVTDVRAVSATSTQSPQRVATPTPGAEHF